MVGWVRETATISPALAIGRTVRETKTNKEHGRPNLMVISSQDGNAFSKGYASLEPHPGVTVLRFPFQR
jgi:hypothetical protein